MGNFKREEAAFGLERRAAAEEVGDGAGVEGGGHDDDAEVGAFGLLETADEGEREVGFEVAFVEFVEDHDADAFEFGIGHHAAGENAFGEEAEARFRAGDLFEADLVADSFADAFGEFGSHAASCHAGGDAAGFEDQNVAAESEQCGGHAGGLAGAGRGLDDQVRGAAQGGDDLRQQ